MPVWVTLRRRLYDHIGQYRGCNSELRTAQPFARIPPSHARDAHGLHLRLSLLVYNVRGIIE